MISQQGGGGVWDGGRYKVGGVREIRGYGGGQKMGAANVGATTAVPYELDPAKRPYQL